MHVFADSGGAVPITESGALGFFCTQALGIVIEDGFQELYRRAFGIRKNWFEKIVGFVWVVGFISWSSPVWVYPVGRTMKREDMVLTPSALRPLISYFL